MRVRIFTFLVNIKSVYVAWYCLTLVPVYNQVPNPVYARYSTLRALTVERRHLRTWPPSVWVFHVRAVKLNLLHDNAERVSGGNRPHHTARSLGRERSICPPSPTPKLRTNKAKFISKVPDELKQVSKSIHVQSHSLLTVNGSNLLGIILFRVSICSDSGLIWDLWLQSAKVSSTIMSYV